MKKPSEKFQDKKELRKKLIGLGDRSIRKSYYPQLQQQIKALEASKAKLEEKTADLSKTLEALQKEKEKFRFLTENMVDVVWTADRQFNTTYVSPSILKVLGFTPEERMKQPVQETMTTESSQKAYRAFAEELVRDADPNVDPYRTVTLELEYIKKDGSSRWFENTLKALRDEKGRITGFIGSSRDIHERRITEMEKAALEKRLMQSRKMESIGTLAGGIAHDFNNILTSIIGYAELSMDDVTPGSLLERNLQHLYNAGLRARDLVAQILTFARKTDDEIKPVQVSIIVKEALKFLRSSLPSTIKIMHNISSDAPALANPGQMHQVIMNLCTNAGQSMVETGGNLRVELNDVSVDGTFTRKNPEMKPGPYLKLSVSDTGTGISRDIIKNIFEPYFTTKKPGEGTGMGLATVYGIVKKAGGDITVHSRVGVGSEFTVFLPAIEREPVIESPESETFPTGKERILLVDDEPAIVNMERQILERLGYRTTVQTDSREALKLFCAKPDAFDLVITDMTMPHMTGDRLAMEMVAIRPELPVILCTGYHKQVSQENIKGMGIRGFFSKPIVKSELARLVREVLGEKDCNTSLFPSEK